MDAGCDGVKLNQDLKMSLDNEILRCLGNESHSLVNILNDYESEEDESNNLGIIKNSGYYAEELVNVLKSNNKTLKIYSSNLDSIFAKHSEIILMLEELCSENIEYDILCFQECHLSDSSDLTLIQIPGYKCIAKACTSSKKGGLILFLKEDYSYKNLTVNYDKTLWENQFTEISGPNLQNPIIIGNVYRPPKNVNQHYRLFTNEITKILQDLNRTNKEVIIAGDFNINLLKIYEKRAFNTFFESMISNSFFPKITFPTRFSATRGSLIDNFFCKISNVSIKAISGIAISRLSDHHPYFICIDVLKKKQIHPEYINVSRAKPTANEDFLRELIDSNMATKLDLSDNASPEINYNLLDEKLNEL